MRGGEGEVARERRRGSCRACPDARSTHCEKSRAVASSIPPRGPFRGPCPPSLKALPFRKPAPPLQDVLENPDGDDHANIRNFISGGWDGVDFPNGLAINPKLAEFSTSTSAVEEVCAPRIAPRGWPSSMPMPLDVPLARAFASAPPGLRSLGFYQEDAARSFSAQSQFCPVQALAASSSISGDAEWDPDSDIWIP